MGVWINLAAFQEIHMKRDIRILPACCLLLFLGSPNLALSDEARTTAPTTAPTSAGPHIVTLTIHPAAAPILALRYQLSPPVQEETDEDAAPLYYMAAQLAAAADAAPHPGQPSNAEQVEAWLELSPEQLPKEQVRGVIDRSSSALELVMLAAHRTRCDWALPLRQQGFAMLLPHLSGLRNLARLLALRARLQIADGEFENALRTLQAGTMMARQLNQQAFLVQSLVAIAIESMMLESVEAWIDRADAPNLYWGLTQLPTPFIDVRAALRQESSAVYTIPHLREAAEGRITAGEWQSMLRSLEAISAEGPNAQRYSLLDAAAAIARLPAARQGLINQGIPATRLDAMEPFQVIAMFAVSDYERWWQDLTKWFAVPFPEGNAGMAAVERDYIRARLAGQTGPLSALVPAVSRANWSITRLDRKIAMLRTIEAVRAYAATHGNTLPATLEAIVDMPVPSDPATNRSFKYDAAADGRHCTLIAPAPNDHPASDEWRYTLNLAK